MGVQHSPSSHSRTDYIVNLRELSLEDRVWAGAKGASLGELARAGFPVPDGFVLTTVAHERFMAANGLGPSSQPEAALAATLPHDIAGYIGDASTALCECPLAVRSSGVAEDLSNASFAGQYETVLDVRGATAVTEAVRRVWASALSEHIAAYRAAQGQNGGHGMAIVIQRLIPAEAAGVAFTANPVSGDRTETVVSAVCGLGDRLVAGEASPDEWVVRGDQAICRTAPEGAIDEGQARAIAELARRVEAHFGVPQDIEWAVAAGETYLLQARPITTLPEQTQARQAIEPVPVTVEPPPGFWQREASHSPLPHSPMFGSVVYEPRARALKHMCDEFGFLADRLEMQQIGGWEYMRLVPLGGKDRPAPPARLMPALLRLVPAMRRRINESVTAMRADRPGRIIEQWYLEWQPELAARGAELRDVTVPALSDTELIAHTAQTVAFLESALDHHFVLHGAVGIVVGEFALTCRHLLGWDEAKAFEMLNGLSHKSTDPARALADLARMAKQKPEVRRLLDAMDATAAGRLAETDHDFASAFAAYVRDYCHRCLRYELADPTVAETPVLVLNLLRDQIIRGFDPWAVAEAGERQRAAAVASARALLAARPDQQRQRFERVLARAELAYPVREDNQFYTVSIPLALVRYAVLELGTRLAQRGAIEQPADVFFLQVGEARSALALSGQAAAGSAANSRELVLRRKGERLWVEAHPGPPSYGRDPGAPPSFGALPPEARLAMEALLWAIHHIMAPEQSQAFQQAGRPVRGIAASAGVYTGPARIVMGESEFGKVRAGDVLVCPVTSPVWSVLFPSVGALVTDTGGILSHPAIIAREYRVPAVVATGNATGLFSDGQMVTVDGTAGTVEVLQAR